MKRIKIIRKGVVTNGGEGEDSEMDAWLASCLSKNKFGKPERWVREGDEDISAALETREVELEPAILDEQGNVITPAVMVTEYKLAAQFTVVEEDMTAEVAKETARLAAIKAAQDRIDAIDIPQKFAGVTTLAAMKLVIQEIMSDIVALRKSR